MIYPIVLYGDPVLRKKTENVKKDYPGLTQLIEDMFETMYDANGVGLAAPQIGKSLRLFVVDGAPLDEQALAGFKKVFINPEILEEGEEEWKFEEGCLSIPGIREQIDRPEEITVRYFNEKFEEKSEILSGLKARIFQHEYDHIEGILFPDHLSAFKKSLLKGKLNAITKGEVKPAYPYKIYQGRKRK